MSINNVLLKYIPKKKINPDPDINKTYNEILLLKEQNQLLSIDKKLTELEQLSFRLIKEIEDGGVVMILTMILTMMEMVRSIVIKCFNMIIALQLLFHLI